MGKELTLFVVLGLALLAVFAVAAWAMVRGRRPEGRPAIRLIPSDDPEPVSTHDPSKRTADEILAECPRASLGKKRWHSDPMTDPQRAVFEQHGIEYDPKRLTKGEASLIIDQLFKDDGNR